MSRSADNHVVLPHHVGFSSALKPGVTWWVVVRIGRPFQAEYDTVLGRVWYLEVSVTS
jgi:hypothetical protein